MELSVFIDFILLNLKFFLIIGIMGGFIIFFIFSYEIIILMNDGRYLLGFSNIFLNLFLSLGGVILLILLCKVIF